MGRGILLTPIGNLAWLYPLRALADPVSSWWLRSPRAPMVRGPSGAQREQSCGRAKLCLRAHSSTPWETGSQQLSDGMARCRHTLHSCTTLGIEC